MIFLNLNITLFDSDIEYIEICMNVLEWHVAICLSLKEVLIAKWEVTYKWKITFNLCVWKIL